MAAPPQRLNSSAQVGHLQASGNLPPIAWGLQLTRLGENLKES
jgi:hypothetical protein